MESVTAEPSVGRAMSAESDVDVQARSNAGGGGGEAYQRQGAVREQWNQKAELDGWRGMEEERRECEVEKAFVLEV
jgi:hypothetical protein